MAVKVLKSEVRMHNMRTRFPFRYGIAELTALPHLFVRLNCEIDGQAVQGTAADGLIPKWFTKDPRSSYQDEISDMIEVIQSACTFSMDIGSADTVFDLWKQLYTRQKNWAERRGFPSLLWNFGVSLVERAVIDAACRAYGLPFARILRKNLLGIRLGEIHQELQGLHPADLIPSAPLEQIFIRHTVGLADHLRESEIPLGERKFDGLPQSLEASVLAYAPRYYKVKVSGDTPADLSRLKQVSLLLTELDIPDIAFTLDGNEQYKDVDQFREFWQRLCDDPGLCSFMDHLLFAEQPLRRDHALTPVTGEKLQAWTDRPAVIIDESDSELHSLALALELGYQGTSHKNCKGIFKGIANACLLENLRRSKPEACYILSGEDLANIGPVALLQDLAVMSSLGVEHVERNGHYYFAGLSMFSDSIQREILLSHPDLYTQIEKGFAALKIKDGIIQVDSINRAPGFGSNAAVDLLDFISLSEWQYQSLAIP